MHCNTIAMESRTARNFSIWEVFHAVGMVLNPQIQRFNVASVWNVLDRWFARHHSRTHNEYPAL